MRKTLMTILRNKNTDISLFRKTADKIVHSLAQETMKFVKEKDIVIETPLEKTKGAKISQEIVLIPILRSGSAFLPIFMYYFENAKIGFIGLKRDEKTAMAEKYYSNLPKIKKDDLVIILDPMIATGGSAIYALKMLKEQKIEEKNILFVSLIAAPEGLTAVKKEFPNVNIITHVIDKGLNKNKYILPGLGDFGDRYFGTL